MSLNPKSRRSSALRRRTGSLTFNDPVANDRGSFTGQKCSTFLRGAELITAGSGAIAVAGTGGYSGRSSKVGVVDGDIVVRSCGGHAATTSRPSAVAIENIDGIRSTGSDMLVRHRALPLRTFGLRALMQRCYVGRGALCQILLVCSLFTPVLGQETISTDTTQTGGTHTTTGNTGIHQGFLFITDPTNDPTLTLESNATRNSRGLVIGTSSNGTGNLVIQSGSSLINTLDTPGGSGGLVVGGNNDTRVNIGQAHLGLTAGTTGTATVTGAGSQWQNSSSLFVGNAGTGTLSIENGGLVTGTSGNSIGLRAGSIGTVTVSDQGSHWNGLDLGVGGLGTGTLSIQNGGLVTSNVGAVGDNLGSLGTVTVNGPNSAWQTSSDLRVGMRGTGMLSVENGGTVSSTSGSIGNRETGVGTVNVSGANSQWQSKNGITVGQSGLGNLSIQVGGSVTSTGGSSLLGFFSGSEGVVTVTGAGSEWRNEGSLFVGENGTGTLSVESGGVVSNKDGIVAGKAGSVGAVTVTGANSQWQNNRNLRIGSGNGDSFGTVTVSDGGTISVGGRLFIGEGSTLNVDPSGSLNFTIADRIINNGVINAQFDAIDREILGSGTFSDLTVGVGTVVNPGNSPGILNTINTEWGNGGTYLWEVATLEGDSGVDWDLWNANDLSILSSGTFTIEMMSIDNNSNPVALAGWDPTQNYEWLIATSTNGAFTDTALLNLDLNYAGFESFHSLDGGSFGLFSMDSNNLLYVGFNATAVPEPSSLALVGTGVIVVSCLRRRRRSKLERAKGHAEEGFDLDDL